MNMTGPVIIRRLRAWFLSAKRTPAVVIPGIAVAVGLLPMPDGYYMFPRIVVSVTCLYYLTSARARDWEKWVLVGLAVLYNPIVPVELGSKLLWSFISIATVIYFWVLSKRVATTWL